MSDTVLKYPRSANSNAKTTTSPSSVVPRDHIEVSPGILREVSADQYRVASNAGLVEYLFWSAHDANIATVEDSTWARASAVLPLSGALTVGDYEDGTCRFLVNHWSGEDVGGIQSLEVTVEGLNISLTVLSLHNNVALVDGTPLGGGFSPSRGDTVASCTAWPSSAKFWWTKNEPGMERFAWDGTAQRWTPLRGSMPITVGIVGVDNLVLVPRPFRFAVGSLLPQANYSMLRVGSSPGEESASLNVLVVPDGTGEFPSDDVEHDAVLEQETGLLWLSGQFILEHFGETLWYSCETFQTGLDGRLGKVGDDVYLCPIPRRTDMPLLRIGSRKYLKTVRVEDEAALAALVLQDGEVGWASSTGKVKLNDADLSRSDRDDQAFDILYLDAALFYDGISMTTVPVSCRSPTRLVHEDMSPATVGGGDLYIPDSTLLPHPGTSGVSSVPDGTGVLPNEDFLTQSKPSGSGLIRHIGEAIVFCDGAVFDVVSVDFESDLPKFAFKIPSGEAHVSLETSTAAGSRLMLSKDDERAHQGKAIYFLQPLVTPASYTEEPLITSLVAEPYSLVGTEVVYFSLDGTTYEWEASSVGAGEHTAQTIASSMDAVVTGTGQVTHENGRLVLSGSTSAAVEYGTASFVESDLAGYTALGLLLGARASTSGGWLPDTGLSMVLRRSSSGLDTRATSRHEDVILSRSVPPSTMFPLSQTPLLDVPGYYETEYFKIVDGRYQTPLLPAKDLLYDFDHKKILWVDEAVREAVVVKSTSTLSSDPGVFFSTVHPGVTTNGGLYVDEDGAGYVREEDFEAEGSSGDILLTNPVGQEISRGSGASYTEGTTTITGSFDGLAVGYWIEVDDRLYRITDIEGEGDTLIVSPPLESTSDHAPWVLYEGFYGFDPSLVADVSYVEFPSTSDVHVKILRHLGVLDSDTTITVASATTARRLYLRSETTEIECFFLKKYSMGSLANSMLVPDTENYHFQESSFSVIVGSVEYLEGNGLVGVEEFSEEVVDVEYGLPGSPIEGEIRFGSAVLSDLALSEVYFSERMTTAPSYGEIDPSSGLINAPQLLGEDCTLVTSLVLGSDAEVRPTTGGILLREPMTSGDELEVTYWTSPENEVTEVLTSTIRDEVATRTSSRTYVFNPDDLTIAEVIGVWVDGRMQNYGAHRQCRVSGNTLTFTRPILDGAVVKVKYTIVEARGGETSYTTSTYPLYSPPFLIPARGTSFTLPGDQTSIFQIGCLVRIRSFVTYVKAVSYSSEQTTITIHPPPNSEMGTRAPHAPILRLVTSDPVVTSVDGTSTGADPGFMLSVGQTMEDVPSGSTFVVVAGDVTGLARSGHVLDVGGRPRIVTSSELAEDGRSTAISVALPFPKIAGASEVLLSARPVYPPDPSVFLGIGPVQDVRVFVQERGKPGVFLTRGRDYEVDEATGSVRLTNPARPSLNPGASLRMMHTKLRELSPKVIDGALIVPRYKVVGLKRSVPNFGGYLIGTFTVSSPDSFYLRVVPIEDWVGDVRQKYLDEKNNRQNGGSFVVSNGPLDDWMYGTVSGEGRIRELQDEDRAARSLMSSYDDVIRYMEQISEATDGLVVGDRDGKFKFFVGRGRTYGGPGYEDSITGYLIPHLAWSDVHESRGDFPVSVGDPVVDPSTSTKNFNGVVSGRPPDPWLLSVMVEEQRSMVLNDIDDYILTSTEGKLTFPFDYVLQGVYQQMWEPGILSRIYPERTTAFSTTMPGIGSGDLPESPGEYSFAKVVQDASGKAAVASTFARPVGTLQNPVLGDLTRLAGRVRVSERLPRARVWSYSPDGYVDVEPSTAGVPTIMAVMTPTTEVRTSGDDVSLSSLYSQGGDLPDLASGDLSSSDPPFVPYDDESGTYPQLALGRPDGEVLRIGTTTRMKVLPSSLQAYGAVFVGEIFSGCLLTLTDGESRIEDPSSLVVIDADGNTSPLVMRRGDTIFVVPPSDLDTSSLADPPTTEDLGKLSKQQPYVDVGVQERTGQITDYGLPSLRDPSFPLQEVLGQKVARPLMAYQAVVEFFNSSVRPTKIPALLGQPLDDSGDRKTPFLSNSSSELDLLSEVMHQGHILLSDDSTPSPLYPDEIYAGDGVVDPASALITTGTDLLPITTAGSYSPNSGITDSRSYDLLILEVSPSGLPGVQGIFQIGAVSHNSVSQPRFVTPTVLGDVFKYKFDAVMAHVSPDGTTGIVVSEVGPNTILTLTGTTAQVDGLSSILNNALAPYPNNNVLSIDLISQTTGLILETLVVTNTTAIGGFGVSPMSGVPAFLGSTITISATGFVDFIALGSPSPSGPYSFRISVDGSVDGTDTASILEDRLTVSDVIDFRDVQSRGSVTIGGVSLQGEFSLLECSPGGTVNSPAEVNGGLPFTFLFSGSEGSISVPSWEGHGNNPLSPTSDVSFSVLTSASSNNSGPLLEGSGSADGSCYISDVVPTSGSVGDVQSGDVVVVDMGVTCGSYLVRHAVPDETGFGYAEVFPTTVAGSRSGWVVVDFPKISRSSIALLEIDVTSTTSAWDTPSGTGWSSTGRLYVFPDLSDLTTALSIEYSSHSADIEGTITFSIVSGTGLDANGAPTSDVIFFDRAEDGLLVSGMVYLPVGSFPSPAPDNNFVGHPSSICGFMAITIEGDAGSVTLTSGSDLVDSTSSPPGLNELGVTQTTSLSIADSSTFVSDRSAPVYVGVPTYIDLTGLADLTSTVFPSLRSSPLRCLLPGDRISAHDGSRTTGSGFRVQAGIFTEPSMPKSCLDVGNSTVKVVDAGHSLNPADVGMRNPGDYGVTSPETVNFSIRRPRRFHGPQSVFSDALEDMALLYEERVGVVTSYDASTMILTTSSGTSLGGFLDVGVSPGDEVTMFRGDDVLDSSLVARVVSSNILRMRSPGFTDVLPGDTFLIKLKKAIVPLVQSVKQLTDATHDVIFSSTSGYVEDVNVLLDDSVNFATAGVEVGDVIVVDPAGLLEGPSGSATPPERGVGPQGDRSTTGRAEHSPGSPSPFDDNRGSYVVLSASSEQLEVSGESLFAGSAGDPAVFGSASPSDQRFVLLPEITGSVLTSGDEGQCDLRPTAIAGTGTSDPNSYAGSPASVGPFSYRVMRRKSFVSEDASEFILFLRERVLTWVEKVSTETRRGGTYYNFQDEEHASELPSPSDVTSGLGVVTNALIQDIVGDLSTAPFSNTSSCSSALDRRYWAGDVRLDVETPNGGSNPYSSFETDESVAGYTLGSGRPLLKDYIESILDLQDNWRGLRYSWLRRRTDRRTGNLPLLQRAMTTVEEDAIDSEDVLE